MEPSTQASSGYDDPMVATQAKNLTKAIFQHESGTNFDAVGDAGTSHGAGQWQPNTWKAQAHDVLGDENAPMTPQNQSVVAQGTIRKLISQGKNAAQIAAIWNSGSDTGWEDKVGTATINGQKVPYNVPKYVKDVTDLYQQYKGQTQPLASAQVPEQPPQASESPVPNLSSIGDELANNIASRFQQGSDALSGGLSDAASGNLHGAASGALQTAGALAGGVGDIANSALELIPGVQAAEHGVSGILSKIAKTPTGQSIAKSLSDFTQAHPELSGDIGAGVNIASILPMFKGLSLIKGGVTDAATSAFKGNLEGAARDEIGSALNQTARTSLRGAEGRGLDPMGIITSDHKNLPEIMERPGGASFEYSGEKGAANIQSSLSQDEEQLQNLLNQGVKQNVMVNLDQAKEQMLKDVVKDFPVSAKAGQGVKAINELFDNIAPSTGGRNWISLNELNGIKRDIGGGINWMNIGIKNGEVKSSMYRSLASQVEKGAAQAGVKGVKELNRTMGQKIEALKILKAIHGKTVKQSQFGKFLREATADLAGGAGELAGSGSGIPFASTLAGRGLARFLPGRIPLTATKLLGRNGRGSVKTSLTQGLLKSGGAQALRGLVSPRQGGQ